MAITLPWAQRRPIEFESRVCELTGLRIDLVAQRLIVTNATTAIVFLLLGGAAAFFVGLTRWPALGLLAGSPELYYRILTLHGQDMLLYWIIFFEVAGLYFGSTVALNARQVRPELAWLAYALMLGGAVLTNVVVLLGGGDVMWDAYVPLKAHPLFYLGYDLFAVGAILAVGLFFANLVVARAEGRLSGSLPLFTFGLVAAGIIAIFSLIGGVISFVPALFWVLGWFNLDAEVYRLNLWAIGHGSQQINLAAMVSVWYLLATLTTGASPLNQALSRFAFILYILFIDLGSNHHLLVDPGLSIGFKIWDTSYALYAAVLGSMIHAYSIPAAVEVAQRARGFARGWFTWLRRAPWGNPGFSAFALSMVGFGFLGGTTGVVWGHEQLNILVHNTLAIPGHFHATVVLGTTLAFMGLTYYLIPLIFRRELVGLRWARWQPPIYFVGLVLLTSGMKAAGTIFDVPRRVPSLTYAGAPVPVTFDGTAYLFLTIMGVGAVIALVGGALFLAIVLASVLRGRPIPVGTTPQSLPVARVVDPQTVPHDTRGTAVLVSVFLVFFALVFVGQYVHLAQLWPVH
jgi:cytochrome c oxidase subunit 1